MKEVIKYEAFDGKLFDIKENCEEYETNHPLFNPQSIKFYSLNGKKIKNPSESVFIDANRFIAFNEKALVAYQNYCARLGLCVPEFPKLYCKYPLHYMFGAAGWYCIEDVIDQCYADMETGFQDEYEENEEDRHNLVGRL